ncbi:MAG: S41 family peptidase [Cryomorphaceae bacterium]|nr:S41 family peptidase [Cryomorphaceae bacterium]
MRKSLIPLLIGLCLAIGFYIGTYSSPSSTSDSSRLKKISYLLKLIEDNHLDALKVDSLLENSISDLLHQLDPHSAYLSPEEVQRSSESVKGKFVGIGIEFNQLGDSVRVMSIIPDGPAAQSGIRGGDILLRADTAVLSGVGKNNAETITHLKGKNKSTVNVEVLRNRQVFDVDITRGEVSIPSVDVWFGFNDDIGFIRINRFGEQTTKEFDRAIKSLGNSISKGLIIDLRDNPGGLLHQAVQITGKMLQTGDTIVFVENNKGNREYFVNKSKKQIINSPIVVLINEGSASAAEILAGAIQDNDRGLVIGHRSFGKGLVQEEVGLPDGSKIRLTTSKYFTPSGRTIQKSYANGYENYKNEIHHRYHSPSNGSDSSSIPIYYTKNKRAIFGGGGVRPDIELNKDTLSFSQSAFFHLGNERRLTSIYHYVSTHFDSLSNVSSEQIWLTPDSTIITNIFGGDFPDKNDKSTAEYIKQQILLMVFDRPTMSEFTLRNDPAVEKAIQAINGGAIDKLLNK